MSCFSLLFRSCGGGESIVKEDGIQKIRDSEDACIKKQHFLEKKIETEVKYARENARLNKQGTMRAIQRKKRYDKQLQQIDGTIASLEI